MKLAELLARTGHRTEAKTHGCVLVWVNCATGNHRVEYWNLDDYLVSSQSAVWLWLVPKGVK